MDVTLFVPTQPTLREHVRTLAGPSTQCRRNDFLRVPHSVNGCGVDPVHAQLERAMNRADRLFVVLLAPTEFPTGSTDRPRAKANWRNRQVGITEFLRFHNNFFKFHFSAVVREPGGG